ncbi:MAG: hypothetical protein AABO58_12845 [Acidobacteriota bacterium]
MWNAVVLDGWPGGVPTPHVTGAEDGAQPAGGTPALLYSAAWQWSNSF